jgi:hypothetical protein
MTNNNKHQSDRRVFSRQSHMTIVQILPTSGIVSTGRRTNGLHPARQTRVIPRDVATDISRDSARPTAIQTGEWPGHPMHKERSQSGGQGTRTDIAPMQLHRSQSNGHRDPHHRRVVTLQQFGVRLKSEHRTNIPDPGTESHTQSSRHTSGREVSQRPDSTPASKESVQRPLHGVRQDKAHFESVPPTSPQPSLVTKVTLSPFTNNDVVRSQNGNGARQKSCRISFWADLALQERLKRVLLREGLSISATCAAFLRKSLQEDIDLEYSATLEPILHRSIARNMRGIATRLSWLLVRVAFDCGQTRSLVKAAYCAADAMAKRPALTAAPRDGLSFGRSAPEGWPSTGPTKGMGFL